MNRIKLLSAELVNQIAAGEVIERPASILKELLENSLDAGSTSIKIYIEHGGLVGIKVVDNGCGIHEDDLNLALTQHATSKINTVLDLQEIHSLGFRGEALASIASVARTNLSSSLGKGTTVTVEDLFYNVPARRKFLRSHTTEFNYLLEVFKRIALGNFGVAFSLYKDGVLVKNLPKATTETEKLKRIKKLCGHRFANHAIYVDATHNELKFHGWITKESYTGSCASLQYSYVNQRIVKDRLLNSAIKQATTKLNLANQYCVYLLIDPQKVDVNVHPSKYEVRFAEQKLVYALIYQSIIDLFKQIQTGNDPVKSGADYGKMLENYKAPTDLEAARPVSTIKSLEAISLMNNKYLLLNNDQNLQALNTHSAILWLIEHELANGISKKIELLVPERVTVAAQENIETQFAKLSEYNFDVNWINYDKLIVRAIPAVLIKFGTGFSYQQFFKQLDQVIDQQEKLIKLMLSCVIILENTVSTEVITHLCNDLTQKGYKFKNIKLKQLLDFIDG